ncbi:multicopper oxidase domain-containing protein [Bradyrhizobium japonicum]|nr:multicopper oxidase domain-containing protein [Bradyrhizobium japonicum]MCD9106060.1 multicopper oxidase domain-containing protein [Bradyrhizobium japonicum]MCD9913607.1 multicopper oxidase domain-containing protein [Bradyrhizobium japonicum]MCS3979541.1 FtsP/CotA-like multicopper oxidase with cupredoxin domain [Bradyrhizobium japonicum]WLB31560.1 multicopper oxidase domain-containing protein [Bradyrhizobium japonicum]WRI73928.1 multicopper oxidase domain-containing protein [Bradyrhizobium 
MTARAVPPVRAQTLNKAADHKIRIAPVSLEIAPGKIIRTTAYNGTVPGPALRVKEGQPVRIEVTNDSGYPNLIHSHGLMIPPEQDGATEEGSPIIEPGKSLIYEYVAKPAGPAGTTATRWP